MINIIFYSLSKSRQKALIDALNYLKV